MIEQKRLRALEAKQENLTVEALQAREEAERVETATLPALEAQ